MTRRIAFFTNDCSFESFVKTTALTLTKLNYQIDIFNEIKEDIDLVILDFDNPENIDVIKSTRNNPNLKNKKIVGVISEITDKKIYFEAGCDSIMTKKEFEVAGNNILMY